MLIDNATRITIQRDYLPEVEPESATWNVASDILSEACTVNDLLFSLVYSIMEIKHGESFDLISPYASYSDLVNSYPTEINEVFEFTFTKFSHNWMGGLESNDDDAKELNYHNIEARDLHKFNGVWRMYIKNGIVDLRIDEIEKLCASMNLNMDNFRDEAHEQHNMIGEIIVHTRIVSLYHSSQGKSMSKRKSSLREAIDAAILKKPIYRAGDNNMISKCISNGNLVVLYFDPLYDVSTNLSGMKEFSTGLSKDGGFLMRAISRDTTLMFREHSIESQLINLVTFVSSTLKDSGVHITAEPNSVMEMLKTIRSGIEIDDITSHWNDFRSANYQNREVKISVKSQLMGLFVQVVDEIKDWINLNFINSKRESVSVVSDLNAPIYNGTYLIGIRTSDTTSSSSLHPLSDYGLLEYSSRNWIPPKLSPLSNIPPFLADTIDYIAVLYAHIWDPRQCLSHTYLPNQYYTPQQDIITESTKFDIPVYSSSGGSNLQSTSISRFKTKVGSGYSISVRSRLGLISKLFGKNTKNVGWARFCSRLSSIRVEYGISLDEKRVFSGIITREQAVSISAEDDYSKALQELAITDDSTNQMFNVMMTSTSSTNFVLGYQIIRTGALTSFDIKSTHHVANISPKRLDGITLDTSKYYSEPHSLPLLRFLPRDTNNIRSRSLDNYSIDTAMRFSIRLAEQSNSGTYFVVNEKDMLRAKTYSFFSIVMDMTLVSRGDDMTFNAGLCNSSYSQTAPVLGTHEWKRTERSSRTSHYTHVGITISHVHSLPYSKERITLWHEKEILRKDIVRNHKYPGMVIKAQVEKNIKMWPPMQHNYPSISSHPLDDNRHTPSHHNMPANRSSDSFSLCWKLPVYFVNFLHYNSGKLFDDISSIENHHHTASAKWSMFINTNSRSGGEVDIKPLDVFEGFWDSRADTLMLAIMSLISNSDILHQEYNPSARESIIDSKSQLTIKYGAMYMLPSKESMTPLCDQITDRKFDREGMLACGSPVFVRKERDEIGLKYATALKNYRSELCKHASVYLKSTLDERDEIEKELSLIITDMYRIQDLLNSMNGFEAKLSDKVLVEQVYRMLLQSIQKH